MCPKAKALLEKALRFGMESSIKTKMKEAKRQGYIHLTQLARERE